MQDLTGSIGKKELTPFEQAQYNLWAFTTKAIFNSQLAELLNRAEYLEKMDIIDDKLTTAAGLEGSDDGARKKRILHEKKVVDTAIKIFLESCDVDIPEA